MIMLFVSSSSRTICNRIRASQFQVLRHFNGFLFDLNVIHFFLFNVIAIFGLRTIWLFITAPYGEIRNRNRNKSFSDHITLFALLFRFQHSYTS